MNELSDEEVRLDLLKCAVMNSALFNTMGDLLVNHPKPEKLDPHAARLRRIFMELDYARRN